VGGCATWVCGLVWVGWFHGRSWDKTVVFYHRCGFGTQLFA